MLGETFYRVHGQVIQTTPFTKEQVKEALTNTGLVVEKESLYESNTDDPMVNLVSLISHSF
jgi:beta-N-acetylglucosaminidase